ncbi:GDP-mannose transporter GONST4-like [Hibiscus syriacus]|uniref:DELLA protein n=1 Tax=Hibiscus syriacus TaxID=106335 RepID=A0A6A3BFI2_HIBSY|nr:DELLA protein SLR1-like [Hibiscus syriacus]KAE8714168.1 GDP-mannose transporter GONST4-like [Hibiscus syriacus]
MVLYDSATLAGSSSGSSSSSSSKPPPLQPEQRQDIDGHLAGAGYKVRSSELRKVAQRLERLETAMVNSPADLSQLASDTIHYNPSDLASWVDSLLSEFPLTPTCPAEFVTDPVTNQTVVNDAWTTTETNMLLVPQNVSYEQQNLNNQLTVVTAMEEDSGIRLVHMLMTCAECVQCGDFSLATSFLEDMQGLLTRVNTVCGIGKVAGHFIDALSRRIFQGIGGGSINGGSAYENEILYHHFYEACPYLKFAHFTANQAILEAFDGHDCVHVVDFNLMHGLQWPALIQALALRPGGPPLLRLTGIGPPSPDGRDSLREVGLRLAELARSVNVRFAFRGVAASRLEDVKPWMLQVNPKESVAVNSIMQLHRLLGSDPNRNAPIETVLNWIRSLNPKIMTVVEQEANHNQPGFLYRFTEALHYYSTMFDSLEACTVQPNKALAEIYIQREITNVVSCEGSARVERHEPLAKWRIRLTGAGFRPLHLGSNAYKQASMLLTLFSAEGYSVEENDGYLTLGWHSRPLIAASAWQAVSDAPSEFPVPDTHRLS